MSSVIVKHSYVRGSGAKARAASHINYLQRRPGDDFEKRQFFGRDKDRVETEEIKDRVSEQQTRGVVMHKLILAPGLNEVDLKQYTRDCMQHLERAKGCELDWYAIEHRNTEHAHCHVVVMGKDKDDDVVLFRKHDYRLMRDVGDRYLDRNHLMDRMLQSESRRLLKEKDYRTREERELSDWLDPESKDRKREAERALSDRYIWDLLDKRYKPTFHGQQGRYRMTFKQFQTEQAGRSLEFHELAQRHIAQEYWRVRLHDADLDMVDTVAKELGRIRRNEIEEKDAASMKFDFEQFMQDLDMDEKASQAELNLVFGKSLKDREYSQEDSKPALKRHKAEQASGPDESNDDLSIESELVEVDDLDTGDQVFDQGSSDFEASDLESDGSDDSMVSDPFTLNAAIGEPGEEAGDSDKDDATEGWHE